MHSYGSIGGHACYGVGVECFHNLTVIGLPKVKQVEKRRFTITLERRTKATRWVNGALININHAGAFASAPLMSAMGRKQTLR